MACTKLLREYERLVAKLLELEKKVATATSEAAVQSMSFEDAAEARRFGASLRSGPLPVPLTRASEDQSLR